MKMKTYEHCNWDFLWIHSIGSASEVLFYFSSVEDINKGVFKQSKEDEYEANSHPNINGLHIWDFRQGRNGRWCLAGNGQYGKNA